MNKNKVTNKGAKQEQILARRGTEHKREKRDKLIRVRSRTYEELVKLGQSMLDDFDDIVFRLIKEHKQHAGQWTEEDEREEQRDKEEREQ